MFRCGVNRRRMQEDEVSSDDVGILWDCYYQRYRALNVDALVNSAYCHLLLCCTNALRWSCVRYTKAIQQFSHHCGCFGTNLFFLRTDSTSPLSCCHRPRQHTHESMRPPSLYHLGCGRVVPEWENGPKQEWYVCIQWNFGTQAARPCWKEHTSQSWTLIVQLIISQQQPSLSLHSSTF